MQLVPVSIFVGRAPEKTTGWFSVLFSENWQLVGRFRRLLSIEVGTTGETVRANEAQKLLNWGYTAYDAVRLFDAGQPAATPAVWKGKANTLKLGRPEAIVVAVPAGTASKIKTQVSRPDPLVAPFTKYQAVGSLKVTLDDQPVADVPWSPWKPSSRQGYSAAHGMPCGSGSSKSAG